MKKLIILLPVILIAFPLYSQKKARLTVLDFSVNDISTPEMKSIINTISTYFLQSGKYTVLDISQRDNLLTEMEFSASDCSDLSCQLQAGRLLAAQFIVIGDITKIGSGITINLKIVDVETSAAVKAEVGRYQNIDDLLGGLGDHVRKLCGSQIKVENTPNPKRTTDPRQKTGLDSARELVDQGRKIKEEWQAVLKVLHGRNFQHKHKQKVLEDFVNLYPDNNQYLEKARKRLKLIKKDPKKYDRFYGPFRKNLEVCSFAFAASNYGLGGKIDILTLCLPFFYWDILKIRGSHIHYMNTMEKVYPDSGMEINQNRSSITGSMIFGIPIWLNRFCELRLGTGPSGGLLLAARHDDNWFGLEVYESDYESYFNWSFEASVILHMARHASFQIGFMADLPIIDSFDGELRVNFETDNFGDITDYGEWTSDPYPINYRPLIGGFIGFRF